MTFLDNHTKKSLNNNLISYKRYEEEEMELEHDFERFGVEVDRFTYWVDIEDKVSNFCDYFTNSISKSLITDAIEKAKEMFSVKDDDEDDVYPTDYAQSIAFTLLNDLAEKADILMADFPIPIIAAAEKNSIDLIWELPRVELTINIPSSKARKIGFLGENRNGDRLRGAVSVNQDQVNFLNWLLHN